MSQISQENTCDGVFFNKVLSLQAWNFIKKDSNTEVFSCEIWEIIQNAYFEEHLRTTASGKFYWKILTVLWAILQKIAFPMLFC